MTSKLLGTTADRFLTYENIVFRHNSCQQVLSVGTSTSWRVYFPTLRLKHDQIPTANNRKQKEHATNQLSKKLIAFSTEVIIFHRLPTIYSPKMMHCLGKQSACMHGLPGHRWWVSPENVNKVSDCEIFTLTSYIRKVAFRICTPCTSCFSLTFDWHKQWFRWSFSHRIERQQVLHDSALLLLRN